MPLFSIVTVCFNAAAEINATAESLRRQSCSDYEWVVVDGVSTDDTLDRVRSAGIESLRLLSEPDQGIYDAMNKAVSLSAGQWIYFLNAGDAFADADVLGDVSARIAALPTVRLFYGDMIYVAPQGESVRRFSHVSRLSLPFEDLNHQAVFAHRSLFMALGLFDCRLKTSADYDWLLRVFRGGQPTHYLARLVARFAVGGAHSRNLAALIAERREIRLRYVSSLHLLVGEQVARVRRRIHLWRDRAR